MTNTQIKSISNQQSQFSNQQSKATQSQFIEKYTSNSAISRAKQAQFSSSL